MRNVVVVLFGAAGFDRSAEGVVGAGQRLAVQSGGDLIAVVLGPIEEDAVREVTKRVDRVIVVADDGLSEYQPDFALQALEQIVAPLDSVAVLLGNDIYSQEITPRLAHRLAGSSLADAVAVEWTNGRVRATRSAYGGKAVSVYELKKSPAIVWVRSRAMEVAEERGGNAEVEQGDVSLGELTLRIVERRVEAQDGVRLEDAQIIVSGGRGLGGPEPFELLQDLATAIGAEMGASRAACDSGWVPPTWQVGQTGKKVAPELYIAIAISGASQHLLGMGDSKTITAVNTDPDAPIFRHCSFGIVEDYRNVVTRLTEKLTELQQ